MTTHESDFDIDTGASYGTYQSYIIGFVLSVILTLISFYLVFLGALPPKALYITVGFLAIVQFVIQTVFFLHLNPRSNASWNLISFLFTVLMTVVLVVGTMWIMFNLYEKMGMCDDPVDRNYLMFSSPTLLGVQLCLVKTNQ